LLLSTGAIPQAVIVSGTFADARGDPAEFDACYWIAEFVEIAHCGISHVRYVREAFVRSG
jgi:hypothetical protein